MIRAAVAVAVAALLAALLPAAGSAAETARVVFTFPELKRSSGELMVALYDAQSAYEAKAGAREARAPAGARSVSFEGLKPGRYGAMMFHDVNGDGKMNFGPMGIPLEPYAFSNNAPGRLGPAPWARTVFEVSAGETRQVIRMR